MGLLQDLLKEVPLSSVLRERVALAEEKYERASREAETYKQRIAALERENETVRVQISFKPVVNALSSDTARVLVHLFRAKDMYARDVGAMAEKLRFERNILQHHLDRLQVTGLAETTGGNYLHGHVYWALAPEGRRYVVESKLI